MPTAPTGFAPSAVAEAAMERLGARLAATAYPALHALASGGRPFVEDVERALAVAGSGPEWAWYRLLGLGRSVGLAELAPPEREAAAALVDADLLTEEDGLLTTTGFIVVPALGGYLMTGLPPTHGGPAGATAYLGPDSLRLAACLPPAAGRRVLDLGTGSGVQGLLACRGASAAVLTDVDPDALRFAGLNAALNGSTSPVSLRLGSLFEPLERGERFDLVVSLPPYVPVVEGSGVTVTAAGGVDGLGVVLPLLEGAREALADGGELWAIAQLLCDDEGPLLADRLAGDGGRAVCAELVVELYCSDRHPFRPWLVEIAGRLASHGARLEAGELVAAYSAALRPLGVTGACTALIRARAGSPGSVRVFDGERPIVSASRLRQAGRLVAGPASVEAVGLEGSPAVHLDALAAALLHAFDGERDLAATARAAWGRHPGTDERDIEEMAAWRAGELLRAGLIERQPGADEIAFAPFEEDELDALDHHQRRGEELYRCPDGDGGELVAEEEGWRCPACGGRQTWASLRHLDAPLELGSRPSTVEEPSGESPATDPGTAPSG